MTYYTVNKKKKKIAVNQLIKYSLHSAGNFIKSSYYAERILIVLSIVLSVGNLLYVFFVSNELLDLLFLTITFGMPFMLSFIPRTIYKSYLGREYAYRINEKFGHDAFELQYDYSHAVLGGTAVCHQTIPISHIDRVEVNRLKNEISVYGKVKFESIENGVITNTIDAKCFSFQNVFDMDIIDILNQYNLNIMEVNG